MRPTDPNEPARWIVEQTAGKVDFLERGDSNQLDKLLD